jgi:hypothetical protein
MLYKTEEFSISVSIYTSLTSDNAKLSVGKPMVGVHQWASRALVTTLFPAFSITASLWTRKISGQGECWTDSREVHGAIHKGKESRKESWLFIRIPVHMILYSVNYALLFLEQLRERFNSLRKILNISDNSDSHSCFVQCIERCSNCIVGRTLFSSADAIKWDFRLIIRKFSTQTQGKFLGLRDFGSPHFQN